MCSLAISSAHNSSCVQSATRLVLAVHICFPAHDPHLTHASWQAHAQAQAQNMAFQAHNLQAHAQQLEVESAHAVTTHMNVGLQHQVDQVQYHDSVVLYCQPTVMQIC